MSDATGERQVERHSLGWIGLGQMGSPMAERLLLQDDVELHVHDVSAEAARSFADRGATAHATPCAVADAAEIVFACLPSREVSRAVASGPKGVVEGGKVRLYVETSTIGRTCIQEIARDLAKRRIDTVDGPISGGPPGAREGRLHMMVSGPQGAVAEVTPWLARIGKSVTCLGDTAGQAQIMKLVNNLVMAGNMVVASEGLCMGAKAGLDLERMFEVLAGSTGDSRVLTETLRTHVPSGSYDYGARLSIVEKDVTLGAAEAAELEVRTPILDAVTEIWREASAEGFSARDFTMIARFVERRSGASLRRKG